MKTAVLFSLSASNPAESGSCDCLAAQSTCGASSKLPVGSDSSSPPHTDLDKCLLAEIGRLGGNERKLGAQGALDVFHATLCQMVRENPKAYGTDGNAERQRRVVAELVGSVQTSFLERTVADLRIKAGYVLLLGYWIHRAVFTFFAFGLLVAAVLPLCAVSLMSAQPWGWVPGAVGLLGSIAASVWILSRIRSK